VIHADLKPENILIRTHDGRVKLIDFGFSHIVKPGEHLEVLLFIILWCFVTAHFAKGVRILGDRWDRRILSAF
jgi:serine/threonine protein kinase